MSKPSTDRPKDGHSFFVARTLQALELLAFGPATAGDVAAHLQVHPRTARRLLVALERDDWVTSRARERPGWFEYVPTLRLAALAAHHASRVALADTARPHVRRLHEETGAVAHLAVPAYDSTLCLVHADGPEPDELPTMGELAPCHLTAVGKVLMAHRQPWQEKLLAHPLQSRDGGHVDPALLRAELAEARNRGYATEAGEHRGDVRGVAAPVRIAGGEVVAALGLTWADDHAAGEPHGLGGRVMARAAELSAELRPADPFAAVFGPARGA